MPTSRITDPNLQALRLLTALGSEASLGRAAVAIGISQPYASRLLSKFEAEHQLLLVRRGPAGTSLTRDGHLVAEWATEIVTSIDRLKVSMEALRATHADHVTIGSSLTLAESLVPPLLANFRVKQPRAKLVLRVQNSADVISNVLDGKVDIGFIESPGPVPDPLSVLRVGQDHLVVIAPAQHSWSREIRPISLRELAATPLVMREDGSGTRRMYYRLMEEHHHPVDPFMELNSNVAIRSAVAGGIAPGVLSVLAVSDNDAVPYHLVDTDPRFKRARPLRMIWREPRENDPTVHHFIQHVRSLRRRQGPTHTAGQHSDEGGLGSR